MLEKMKRFIAVDPIEKSQVLFDSENKWGVV